MCWGNAYKWQPTHTRGTLRALIGKDIDLQQWDTLIFKGEHAENEHWRLVEDRIGQNWTSRIRTRGIPGGHHTTADEGESDATKKGQETSTEENRIGGWIGQEGE